MEISSPPVDINICICTFRRPCLTQTLQSLAQLNLPPHLRLSLIIADNDDTPSAQRLVETIALDFLLSIQYIHAPARNISLARNACLDAATAPMIAFIDDDECATPEWINALINQYNKNLADVVLGPVHSRYPANSPAWMRQGDFHSTKPVWIEGRIITGYTCNALLVREAPALQHLRFDLKLGRSGGEDTAFFSAVHKAGGKIDFAPTAIVTEDVTPNRLSFLWLVKRSFRSGQTHGMLLLADTKGALIFRVAALGRALAKALFCGIMAIASWPLGRARFWLLRGTLHVGVVAKLLGLSELTQYG